MYPQELAHARRQLQKGDKGEVRGNILPLKRGADGELSLAMPQMLLDAGTGLLDLLAGTRTGEVTPEATGLLFDIAGGGAASAPLRSAGVGIFGGRLAKTADHGALARAEQMAGEGADRGAIWKDTGWFQGADGKWRFEIDDSQSKAVDIYADPARTDRVVRAGVNTAGNDVPQATGIEDVLSHPELARAYGDIPTGGVLFDNMGSTRGRYNTTNDLITLDDGMVALNPDQTRSVALHELSHVVDAREGFARGGNSLEFPKHVDEEMRNEATRIFRALVIRKIAKDQNIPVNDAVGIYQQRMANPLTGELEPVDGLTMQLARSDADDKQLKEYLKEVESEKVLSPVEAYRRLVGETMARNAQTRADYTPEQRAARPPWETQDVPDEQQIVRFGSGPSLMASLAKGTAKQAGKSDRLNPDSLPMDKDNRMYRAMEMGFDETRKWYHRTNRDFDGFEVGADPKSHSGGGGIWLRRDPRANLSAHQVDGDGAEGAREIPVVIKRGNEVPPSKYQELGLNEHFPVIVTMDENRRLRELGYTHATAPSGHEMVVFDPKDIRSPHAAFDPAKADSTDLLAAHVGTGIGPLGLMEAMRDDPRKRKQDRRRN